MDRRGAAIAFVLIAGFLVGGPGGLARAASADFGFDSVASSFTDSGESPGALPAGSHPGSWVTTLRFNTGGPPGEVVPDGSLKDLRIALPPGLAGAPALLPECQRADFIGEACPASTAVGELRFDIGEPLPAATVYLIAPVPGRAAQLGFHAQQVPTVIDLSISPNPPHNLVAEIANASQAAALRGATLTLEGVPGGIPFLTLPRSCPAPLVVGFAATSWEDPLTWASAAAPEPQSVVGCGALPYSPELEVRPTTTTAAAPSGFDLDLDAPDPGIESAGARAAADTRSATLELPAGMTLNPPVAIGLEGCTPAEVAGEQADADPATGCPEAAKIGSATVTTPLFDQPIGGDVYVARPGRNPFGSLLALYLVLRDPERGIILSLPIRVDADPRSGRLTAGFDQIPELPLSHLSLRFNSGPRAPLATPPGCGTHAVGYSLSPSSGGPPLAGEETFETTSGCDRTFAPQLSAGTASNAAGAASPFALELRNAAGAPNLDGLHLTLPPGIGADLTAAATCPEAGAAGAECPAASRLGYARIALGAGPEPLWVPGGAAPGSDVFLAGPYRGAPFSLLVSVPAVAGPFDLGRVVLRAPVRIDPGTAQISVEFGDLPQIRDGIPLHYRAIRLVLDRSGFVRNPTSCEPMRIDLTATAAGGAIATGSERFQAADCGALRFGPRLSVLLSGGLGRSAHPGVKVSLAPKPGQANLEAATFDLPAGELMDTRHIRALCARELAPARCPATSRLGRVSLHSPLLREPLRGAIYLRAPGHRYPDLVAELEGGGVRVLLHGRTGSARGRLRIRLAGLPDIPLSRATIALAGGRRGIVVNSASLCGHPRRGKAQLRGHNGGQLRLHPRIRLQGGCEGA